MKEDMVPRPKANEPATSSMTGYPTSDQAAGAVSVRRSPALLVNHFLRRPECLAASKLRLIHRVPPVKRHPSIAPRRNSSLEFLAGAPDVVSNFSHRLL